MKLLVLAGGFGTRLKTVVSDVPKALAPIGDVPFLRIQIEHWRVQGLTEFTFLLHHQADQVVDFLESLKVGLLKKLDHRIRVIPLLDGSRHLVGLVSRDHLPIQAEGAVYARARAPVRISFGGGGSDLTHYFSSNNGAVINTTISLYSHVTLRIRDDERVIIRSLDLGETLDADDLTSALATTGRFGLIQALLRAIRPDFGFELFLHSDFPMSSGLGGSAVLSAAILGCFNQFRRDQWDLHELAEIAYQAERHYLGVAGGWQDQYATVFGGFNFMEFRMDQNIVHPLRIHPDTVQLSNALTVSGAQCTVLTLNIGEPLARVEQLGGASIVALPCLNRRFQIPSLEISRVRKLVEAADVVHLVGYWSVLGVVAQFVALRANVPYTICPAGALTLFGRSRWLKRLFNLVLGEQLIRQASGWIAVTRSELPDFAKYGVSSECVSVIPNGVVACDIENIDVPRVQQASEPSSAKILLFMGRLNFIKGPDLLLEAFGRVSARFPEANLVYAGIDEGMVLQLTRRAVELGVDGRVVFPGFLRGEAKRLAYRGACLLVIPSRTEAMSIVAVESGMFGTPVLMTDQCGLDDLREVEPGLVVPASVNGLTRGLEFALEDPLRLRAWGAHWQTIVRERFLWNHLARQFREVHERIIGRMQN